MNYSEKFADLNENEIDYISGGARIGAAAAGAGAAVVGVAVAAFGIGYSIGRDIGKAIFGND